jgi:DNA-binding response OmpR family regulator
MSILILIEDNECDVILTKRAIKKLCPQCDMEVAMDGLKGLQFIYNDENARSIDLILLDLNLPKVDGLEILRKVKSDPEKRKIPVVILTSSSYERDRINAEKNGADMYVVKPLGLKEFENEIKNILTKFILGDVKKFE